jgi:tetratricopeptide (TPR) repeat protein
MINQVFQIEQVVSPKDGIKVIKNSFLMPRFSTILAGAALLIASVAPIPALAADPFRQGTSGRAIGDQTEAAFKAMFQQGNYPLSRKYVLSALKSDAQEPIVYAMAGGMSYLENDWPAMSRYADQTLLAAQRLMPTDPLRGNLYQGVGNFLQAAYALSPAVGGILGTSQALISVQESLAFIEKAKAIDANDPELNLLQGYLEWGIASSVGLFDPKQAIAKLDTYAAPKYLSYRGIALVYRDLRQPEQGLVAIDLALKEAPDNPELIYLKAQILEQQGNRAESLKLMNQAIAKQEQLPAQLIKEITQSRDRLTGKV